MLEYQQDAKAYPLKYTLKHPGMSWAEMAKREGHKKRHPKSPREGSGRAMGVPSKLERIIAGFGPDPLTREQIADKLGISVWSARDYVRIALEAGAIRSAGEVNKVQVFVLVEDK